MTLKKYFPWLLAALLALALIWALSTQAVSLSDVGLIDMGRVLSESDYAQRLNSQLTAKYDQLVAQLQAAAESEEIDENEKAEQDRAIYAEYLRFRQELETQFQQALDRAIAEAADEANLQLVLDVDLVRYGGKDISDDIIKRLD
jgi:outer membrane protein